MSDVGEIVCVFFFSRFFLNSDFSNVPDLRVCYRSDTLAEELAFVNKARLLHGMVAMKTQSQIMLHCATGIETLFSRVTTEHHKSTSQSVNLKRKTVAEDMSSW